MKTLPGRCCLSDTWKGRICCRNLLHHQILSKLVSVLLFHIWLIHKKNNADFKNNNAGFFFSNLWEKDISPPVFQLFPGGPWVTRDLSGLAGSPPDHCTKVSASSIAVISTLIFPYLVCLRLLTGCFPPHPFCLGLIFLILAQGFFFCLVLFKDLGFTPDKIWKCLKEPRASLVAQRVKSLPAVQETCVRSLGREDPLEKDMATPLQYSCLENPMDRGAWWAIYPVHGLTESRTWLSNFTFIFKGTQSGMANNPPSSRASSHHTLSSLGMQGGCELLLTSRLFLSSFSGLAQFPLLHLFFLPKPLCPRRPDWNALSPNKCASAFIVKSLL